MIEDNRQTARDTFAALIRNEVTAAQAVYAYRVADFAGQSPVAVVSSGGTLRGPFTLRGTRPEHYLVVHTFVAYAVADNNWTEQDSENKLDELAAQIAALVDRCQKTAAWNALTQAETSLTDTVVIGGVEYRREVTRYKLT